jgi:hypothetical protein
MGVLGTVDIFGADGVLAGGMVALLILLFLEAAARAAFLDSVLEPSGLGSFCASVLTLAIFLGDLETADWKSDGTVSSEEVGGVEAGVVAFGDSMMTRSCRLLTGGGTTVLDGVIVFFGLGRLTEAAKRLGSCSVVFVESLWIFGFHVLLAEVPKSLMMEFGDVIMVVCFARY